MSSQGAPVRENAATQVLVEIRGRWDVSRLERKQFVDESGVPHDYYWLSRQKPGCKATGTSVRKSEMPALIVAFQRILAGENDGGER